MADNNLQAIVDVAALEPPDLPRLTTANVFITYSRLGVQLSTAFEEYKRLPDATPQNCTEALKALVKNCEAAIANATRLLEANR